MDRKTRLFNRFAEANGLERIVSLWSGAGQQLFRGLERDSLSPEVWMRTIEFTGFVDGYEGHPHKFKGPRGSPDSEFTVGTREIFMDPIPQTSTWLSRISRFIRPGLSAYHVAVRFHDGMPQVRSYDQQYLLGQIAKREYPE
ncbi:MAG TPA: hypothetical protein VJK52_00145 [Candidatus Nanoarchaeia archaeon]|nr:hypothetical protein [Candidatus Nanoarchaeia archaeon]